MANTWRSLHPTIDSKMADKVLQTSSTKEANCKSKTLFGSSSTETATSGNREFNRDVSTPNCKYIFNTNKGARESLISSDINDKIRYEIESAQTSTRVNAETIDRIQHVAVALFVGYIDAALTMSESCGGGGCVYSNWGKGNEDDYLWAQKCARKAIWLCKPRLKRGRGR